mmetsp:Transcript_22887/g.52418  ORF Transcript_22887/g.52418 Transcript_22887/m.52418 type:complete len:173 (+) Transcript_22887:80-598(+)
MWQSRHERTAWNFTLLLAAFMFVPACSLVKPEPGIVPSVRHMAEAPPQLHVEPVAFDQQAPFTDEQPSGNETAQENATSANSSFTGSSMQISSLPSDLQYHKNSINADWRCEYTLSSMCELSGITDYFHIPWRWDSLLCWLILIGVVLIVAIALGMCIAAGTGKWDKLADMV